MKKALQFVAALAFLLPLIVAAQGYPDKPVRIIVPYPPGGPVDLLARELANGWSKALGQSFLVESKPGASGSIGTAYVASSPANGYTLLIGNGGSNITVPALSSKPPYDGIKEFAPIIMAVYVPNVLTLAPHVKAASVQQFIELAKTKRLAFGSAGTGGSTHIAGEIFQREAKVKLTHAPYKGAAPIVNDMLGGHVDCAFLNMSAVLPHIKSGKLRALGVAATTRSKSLPDVPTLSEQGVKDVSGSWYGVLAPAATPAEVVRALYTTGSRYLEQPEVQARIESWGTDVMLLDPQKFLAFMREEKRDLVKIAKELGITID